MKKITMSELDRIFWEYGKEHHNNEDSRDFLEAVIVYKPENWDKEYTEEQRSYKVRSCSRRWQEGKIANSYSGDCLDGTDQGVRLDWYNWKVDYCYLVD